LPLVFCGAVKPRFGCGFEKVQPRSAIVPLIQSSCDTPRLLSSAEPDNDRNARPNSCLLYEFEPHVKGRTERCGENTSLINFPGNVEVYRIYCIPCQLKIHIYLVFIEIFSKTQWKNSPSSSFLCGDLWCRSQRSRPPILAFLNITNEGIKLQKLKIA
jgi:hypothetical protein